jgi:hypothetical protein
MNKLNAIGLCGFARCGKDSFFSIANEYLSNIGYQPYRLSFADILKKDVNEFLYEKTGINAFTEDPKEKELIRDFLVAYGTKLMRRIDENYWISKVEEKMKQLPPWDDTSIPLPIFTDVRYPNELEWIQKALSGTIIHITREGNSPANEEEKNNDPSLRACCDFLFKWNNFKNKKAGELDRSKVKNIIENFHSPTSSICEWDLAK